MLTIDPVLVIPGQRQEYRIDSSIIRLYEIDLKRQIKLSQTFNRLLVFELRRSSQCSTTGITKAVVGAILSVGWCI